MKKIFFIIAFLSAAFTLPAQTTAINQVDENGEKNGKWIVYWDENWDQVDSAAATYIRYTYYDHGVNLYPMGSAGGKKFKLEKPGEDKLLHGEYKWYDGKGKLSSVHVFNEGNYVSAKEYYKSGQVAQHFDYTKKCEGQEHGWTVESFNKKGKSTIWSFCKNTRGKWPMLRG